MDELQKNKYALEKVVDRLKETVKKEFERIEKQRYEGAAPQSIVNRRNIYKL